MSTWASLRRLRFTAIGAALVATLSLPAHADREANPALPAGVAASQQQLVRWIAAFNAWRNIPWTWNGETDSEAKERHETRLFILPKSQPLLSRRRGLDGRAIVVSTGLLLLLDELLLAEAVSDIASTTGPSPATTLGPPDGCFKAYVERALMAIDRDAESRSVWAPEALGAWPRFSALVEAGKAGRLGRAAGERSDGPCAAVTPALLRSAGTRTHVAGSGDALALWLFTQQSLQLSRLPAVSPPTRDDKASTPTCTDAAVPGDKAGKAMRKKDQELVATVAANVRVQVQLQVEVATKVACAPSPPVDTASPDERASQAVAATGPRTTRTLAWLRRHLPLFDAGSNPATPKR